MDTTRTTKPKPHLGRIGELAEEIRCHARNVTDRMKLTPGGDAYEYGGGTGDVDALRIALNALEHFQAGWRS